MTFPGAQAIVDSLSIAATRGGDLTGAIYARLFARFPETEAMFVLDRGGQVRGAMLAHVFEAILDFIGERRFAHHFVAAEIVTHEGFNIRPEAFAAFFGIVRDEVRAACAEEWRADMEDAWRRLLAELERYVARPGSC